MVLPWLVVCAAVVADPPRVVVDRDNVVIDRSCVIEIPAGLVIEDRDGDGVIHIGSDGVQVTFAEGSVLRGASEGTPWDELTGMGIRIEGASGVTVRGARVHGFRVGVRARDADGLLIDGADLSDNWRARLRSTPEAEDSADWISPHRNDNNQWLERYAAALYVEESDGVTVRGVRVRRGQNGIVFDEVSGSRVYDNDASFLSGWGLALWRSSENVITRNRFDFCVRGHSEGVYNRGQDSAGILFFEQCSGNLVAQNSATHSGDGFFGFAGVEALGQEPPSDAGFDHTRAGCNDNLFIHNDFSYAPAHGLEMTFSFGNVVIGNRFVENAICGIWGGFSQDTLIAGNLFDGNGGMPYGLERGGVNIEHGARNVIIENRFVNNRAGVHLWRDDPGEIARLPWGVASYRGVAENVIAGNAFVVNDDPRPFWNVGEGERRVVYHLRSDEPGSFRGTRIFGNTYELTGDRALRLRNDDGVEIHEQATAFSWESPAYEALGEQTAVVIREGVAQSTRDHLRGRDKIVMDEWGPWDHESPLVRLVADDGVWRRYDVLKAGPELSVVVEGDGVLSNVKDIIGGKRLSVFTPAGLHVYRVALSAGDWSHEISGSTLRIWWSGKVFSWAGGPDPREELDRWLSGELRGTRSYMMSVGKLDLPFGWGGPKELHERGLIGDPTASGERIKRSSLGGDYFGMVLEGEAPLPPGTYRVRTLSDDGVRVRVALGEGAYETVIDNWTHHGPTWDEGVFTVDEACDARFEVMHFEIDGYAVLRFDLQRIE